MTNREYLNSLSTDDFVDFMEHIFNSNSMRSLRNYLALRNYLDSEDRDISHFVFSIGTAILLPSASTIMEIEKYHSECGTEFTPELRAKCIEENSKKVILLRKGIDYLYNNKDAEKSNGTEHYTIADFVSWTEYSVPSWRLTDIVLYNSEVGTFQRLPNIEEK